MVRSGLDLAEAPNKNVNIVSTSDFRQNLQEHLKQMNTF